MQKSLSTGDLLQQAVGARKRGGSWMNVLQEELYGTMYEKQSVEGRGNSEFLHFYYVPLYLEKLLLFSYLTCIDAFIDCFTFLPIRVIVGLWSQVFRWPQRQQFVHHIVLGSLFLMTTLHLLYWIDSSIIYHYIRQQAMFKLYVIYNCLEIIDRLCCYFGQDIMHSLCSPSVNEAKVSFLVRFFLGYVYCMIHSLVLVCQLIALNVALHSGLSSILTLLVSNQFVELKSSVFKNYKKENLFQITAGDGVERFQLTLFLLIITALTFYDGGLVVLTPTFLRQWIFYLLVVFFSEISIDWTKHCFITKFNRLDPSLYQTFRILYQRDFIGPNTGRYTAANRMGFVAIPSAAITILLLCQLFPTIDFRNGLVYILLYLVICGVKVGIRGAMESFIHQPFSNTVHTPQRQVSSPHARDLQQLSVISRFSMK